jgi:geranylgeranyl diphosphate synthase, type I
VREFFEEWKATITAEVRAYLRDRAAELGSINRWGPDVTRRVADFTGRGKMIRGGLVALGYLLFRDAPPQAVRRAAAAMELLQSSFLVHDDIMDRDLVRRGLPTVFQQYCEAGDADGIGDSRHFGEAMGICAGDAAFFFAFDILARIDIEPARLLRLLHAAHATVIETCVAQMQDVYLGSIAPDRPVGEDEVLRVYHYKTGRYTFTLPLQVGALIAGREGPALAALEPVGEKLGMIFQIKDDELGLYGTEEEIGKPVGSDVASGKKTIFYVYLMQAVPAGERARVAALFGGGGEGGSRVAEVRRLVESLGVRSRIEERVAALAADAHRAIAALPGARDEYRALLVDLLEYNLSRAR